MSDKGEFLSRGKKALYGLLAPLVVGVIGFWLIEVAPRRGAVRRGARHGALSRAVSRRVCDHRRAEHLGVVCAPPASYKCIPAGRHRASDRGGARLCIPVEDLAVSALGKV